LAKGTKSKRALTRKDFLRAGGIGAAGASLLGAADCRTDRLLRFPARPAPAGSAMNVILVILDSLRKDHSAPTATTGLGHLPSTR
jgi:hypothetical protein